MSDNTRMSTDWLVQLENLPPVTYGDFSARLVQDIPPNSVHALVIKGLAHYLGNEMASKVSAQKDDYRKANGEGVEIPAELVTQWKAEAFNRGVTAIKDGTIGASSRGPRGTKVETEMRRIAEAEIRANLAKFKLVMPSGKDTVKVAGKDWTRAEMIDERVSGRHADRLRKEAERNLAKLEKMAAADGSDNPLDF